MADDLVKVKKTTEEYELKKSDLVPETGDDAPTWYNKLAGLLDKQTKINQKFIWNRSL